MEKRFKRKNSLAVPQDKPVNKIEQQLNAIEKKLDILISQSLKRPFEKSYSQKPSRRFNPSPRHDRERQGDSPRERTYTQVICSECKKECEIPFKSSGDRPVYCKECFSKRRKGSSFSANRNNRPETRDFPRKRRSNKSQSGKRQKSAKNDTPFYANRKKHA